MKIFGNLFAHIHKNMYICIVIRKHKFNFKKQKMDEILEN